MDNGIPLEAIFALFAGVGVFVFAVSRVAEYFVGSVQSALLRALLISVTAFSAVVVAVLSFAYSLPNSEPSSGLAVKVIGVVALATIPNFAIHYLAFRGGRHVTTEQAKEIANNIWISILALPLVACVLVIFAGPIAAAYSVFQWLKTGSWPAMKTLDFVGLVQTDWVGANRIGNWLLQIHVGFWLFIVGAASFLALLSITEWWEKNFGKNG